MAPESTVHPRDDPWLTLPFGVIAAVFGAVAAATGEFGVATALIANAVVALGRTALLLRRGRCRPTLETAVENAWLPVLVGGVMGATAGSLVGGDTVERVGAGAAVGAWVALCLAGALAYYEHLVASGPRG